MQYAGQMAVVVLILALAAGCSGRSSAPPAGSSSSASSGPEARKTCGTSHTAAHVLVEVQVPTRAVDCAVALRVEADYTRELAAGDAPGNGGGGSMPVDGWTCQGYPTPQILQTGRASECHRGGIEFFAVMPAPNA